MIGLKYMLIRNRGVYPAYKPSGVEWLGDVPSHWELVPNRTLMNLKKEVVGDQADYYTVLSLTKQGVIARDMETSVGKFPANFDTYQVVESGDLIFCLFDMDETPRTVGVSRLDGMITGAYTRFICVDKTMREFLFMLYLSLDNGKLLKPLYSGLRKVITKSVFLSAKVALPPKREQAAIVRYLDHADDRIRRYISAKERLITLLEEQKQAIIHRAVTRGLDPNVRFRPSGVGWLGDVPMHWEVRRLKQMSVVQTGITLGKNYRDMELTERPYLRVANVQSGRLDLSTVTTVRVPRSEMERSTLKVGDVLMTEGGDIDKLGRGAVWSGEIPDCLHQNHVFAVRPNRAVLLPAFLVALMGSPYGRDYFQVTAKQTTNLATTNRATLGNLPLCLPSTAEQQRILDYIAKHCDVQDAAIARTRRQIELLREYRTRLIADVVTGKLDVRAAAARLPGEADDQDPIEEGGPLADDMDKDLYNPDGSVEGLAMGNEVTA